MSLKINNTVTDCDSPAFLSRNGTGKRFIRASLILTAFAAIMAIFLSAIPVRAGDLGMGSARAMVSYAIPLNAGEMDSGGARLGLSFYSGGDEIVALRSASQDGYQPMRLHIGELAVDPRMLAYGYPSHTAHRNGHGYSAPQPILGLGARPDAGRRVAQAAPELAGGPETGLRETPEARPAAKERDTTATDAYVKPIPARRERTDAPRKRARHRAASPGKPAPDWRENHVSTLGRDRREAAPAPRARLSRERMRVLYLDLLNVYPLIRDRRLKLKAHRQLTRLYRELTGRSR